MGRNLKLRVGPSISGICELNPSIWLNYKEKACYKVDVLPTGAGCENGRLEAVEILFKSPTVGSGS